MADQVDINTVKPVASHGQTIVPNQQSSQAQPAQNPFAQFSADVEMHRNIKMLEESDLYKNADPRKKLLMQEWFYNKFVTKFNKEKGANVSVRDWVEGRVISDKQKRDKKEVTGIPMSDPRFTSVGEKFAFGIGEGAFSIVEAVQNAAKSLDYKYQETKGNVRDAAQTLQAVLQGNVRGPINIQSPPPVDHVTGKVKIPILGQGETRTIENIRETANNWSAVHYNESLKDVAVHGIGNIVGQIPAFEVAGVATETLGLDALVTAGKESPFLTRVASRMLKNGTEGYLVGMATNDNPKSSAVGFAVGSELINPITKFAGKILAAGGTKLAAQTVNYGLEKVAKDSIETKLPSSFVALAGSPKQKVSAAIVKALNEAAGGDFAKLNKDLQRKAITEVFSKFPEAADQLSVVSPEAAKMFSGVQIMQHAKESPSFGKFAQTFGQATGQDFADAVTGHNIDIKIMSDMKHNPQAVVDAINKQVPGAARAQSIEFQSGLSAKTDRMLKAWGVDNITFESRAHKQLFFLNKLLDEMQTKPTREGNIMFDRTMQELQREYPKYGLKEFIAMSNQLADHIRMLQETNKDLKVWRQTELRPGESPFGHQMQLMREAHKAEQTALENELRGSFKGNEEAVKLEAARKEVENLEAKLKVQTERGDVARNHTLGLLREAQAKRDAFAQGARYTPTEASIKGSGKISESLNEKERKALIKSKLDELDKERELKKALKKDAGAMDYMKQAMQELFPGVPEEEVKKDFTGKLRKVIQRAQELQKGKK